MGCKQGVKPVRNWREADDGHDNDQSIMQSLPAVLTPCCKGKLKVASFICYHWRK